MEDLDEGVTLIDEIRQAYARRCAVYWAVALAETGRVIGLFGFGAWERCHRRAEVGYDLAADYWGRGLATEALAAILSFGFQERCSSTVWRRRPSWTTCHRCVCCCGSVSGRKVYVASTRWRRTARFTIRLSTACCEGIIRKPGG